MKGNVLIAIGLFSMGCLSASATSAASSDVGVRLRLVENARVLGVAPAWPGFVQSKGVLPGPGFGAVNGSAPEALAALTVFAKGLPSIALETRSLDDGWEAWALGTQGCAHILGRQVQGSSVVVTRIEVRACTVK